MLGIYILTFVVFSLAIKFRQPVKGSIQRIVALGKVETDKVMYVLTEETTARNGTHTDMLCRHCL